MNKMDDITKMNLYSLREYINNLEVRRDKLGHGKDVVARLNDARSEIVLRGQ